MARKTQADTALDPRRLVIDTLLRLAAEQDWHDISLADIAHASGISLGQLRALFPSKGAILAAYARQVDQAVLDSADDDMREETARERLFDVLMRRIDVLAPHKAAIRRIAKAFSKDPLSLAAWNRVVTSSMQWMLVAAAIKAEGVSGAFRAQGLAFAWNRIIQTWLKDEDAGLALTMREVDRQLRSGERWLERAEDVFQTFSPLCKIAGRIHERRVRLTDKLCSRLRDIGGVRSQGMDEFGNAEVP